ncbi:MAG TPA: hypothetical protein VFB54_19720 [Burkholderiales bacterium]|nr:hypothetical protein [Burkholderiales bacterium]
MFALGSSTRLAWKSAAGLVLALLWSAGAGAIPITYEWVQSGCDGPAPVCAAPMHGEWTFDSAAVERGSATYFALRDTFPNLVPDGVDTFDFIIGPFVYKTISFRDHWTNADAVYGIGRRDNVGGIYQVSFSADRERIAAISQTSVFHSFEDPTGTTFDVAPENPAISVRITPHSIRYAHDTGSEPQVDGIPVTPHATFTGEWRALALPTPIPAADTLSLIVAAAIPLIETRRRKRQPASSNG